MNRFIYIPTYLRSQSQPMYTQLRAAAYTPILVVDKTDPQNYHEFEHIRVPVKGIASKRAWIAKNAEGIHIVADDDLIILSVDQDGRTSKATNAEVRACINLMAALALSYPHGGVHRRAFVNSAKHLNYKVNTGGYGSLLFYNKHLWHRLPKFQVPHNPAILTDLCSQLDMFKQRLPFAVITRFATKEFHAPEHYLTGCWALSQSGWPSVKLKDPSLIDSVEKALMAFYSPVMKQGRRREIIDWRATKAAWSVPEHVGDPPRAPRVRVTK